MAVNTTTYSFLKPTVGGDTNVWGGFLNSNWDNVDDLLDGTTPVSGIDINGGSIDGTPIGAAAASTGAFTALSASGVFTFGGVGLTGVSGADLTLLTGTAGASGNLGGFNVDGDLVDAGISAVDVLTGADNLAGLADAATSRGNLGLGSAALMEDSADTDLSNDPDAAARRDIVEAAIAAAIASSSDIIAHGEFDGSGTPTFNHQTGFNATITDNGAGNYTLAFDSAEPDTDYTVQVSYQSPGGGIANRYFVAWNNKTVNGFDIIGVNVNGTQTDATISVTVTR